MFALQTRTVTPAQYLVLEASAETKSEFIAGEIVAMSGASLEHSILATEVRRLLGNALSETDCVVLDSDMRVRVSDIGPFFYPDISVVCGPPQVDFDECLRNPLLIVEILSPSTENYDRGEKFRNYRGIDSLEHYVLVAQDQRRVQHFARMEGTLWTLVGDYSAPEESLSLPGLGIQITLADIYRRVALMPDP